ncbi:MAG TPA: hypothetical protein VGH74_18270, partial [Planctomycetaceae bacterium]
QLIWSTGEIWTENLALQGSASGPGIAAGGTTALAAGSAIVVNDYTFNGRTMHVIQTGTNTVVLVNGAGGMALGNWINATQVVVPVWGNDVATFSPGKVNWSDGSLWTGTTTAAPQITVTEYTIFGGSTRVIQNGTSSLVFINKSGGVALGQWISPLQAIVPAWGYDVATFNPGQINWSDGNSWTQSGPPALPVTILDYINPVNGLTMHVVQNSTGNVTFVNGGGSLVLGVMNNPTQATVAAWGNDVATFSPGRINWSDGSVWLQTAAPANRLTLTIYVVASNGRSTSLVRNSSAVGVFVNGGGSMVLGTFSGPTATVAAWNRDVATFAGGTIYWSDGSVWNQATTQAVTIAATDVNGAISHVQVLSATTLVGLDGSLGGVTGTRSNGQIVWSTGVVWNNFDFNALNALFEMSNGYA